MTVVVKTREDPCNIGIETPFGTSSTGTAPT